MHLELMYFLMLLLLSRFSRVQLFATQWNVLCQTPLSMEFSRQEYWSGLPFPSPWIKKTECQRIDAFELWCWRRFLRVPWTARRFNQSILKEIRPEYSLGGLMLKLKLQYFAHLIEELTHLKSPWCWVRLRAGGEGDDRGWDGWMASLTQWMWIWVNSGSWRWTRRPGVLRFMRSQRVGHGWATGLNWTDPKSLYFPNY